MKYTWNVTQLVVYRIFQIIIYKQAEHFANDDIYNIVRR